MKEKTLDLICLGRVAVDLYAQQIGCRLEDVTSFAKYLGGSSGNVAYGTAVQGVKSSMLARVGDEHMGRFLREELQRVGVDTSHLITDKDRLTALVVLGIKDQDTFPLIFYRDNCADMAITAEDFDEEYIASAKALAITGTHLSHPKTRQAVLTALEYAGRNGTKRLLDIDYRPVLWGLTSLGDGETRYIDSEAVTQSLQEVLHHFDVLVGTEEEFHIAGGSTDTLTALKNVRKVSQATLVCKRGALGCSVFEGDIPDDLDGGINVYGVRVEVLNVLGAGDAFMSGLLRGYINGESWEQCCRYANACGALVVSRHGCAPAMPTKIELDNYLARAENVPRPDLDPQLNHLHRVTTRKTQWKDLCIFAFDHRKQLVEMAEKCGANLNKIPTLKKLLLQAAEQTAKQEGIANGYAGVLADTTFGQAALNEITGKGWWIGRPIELPSSRPLRLEHGDLGSQLISWPAEHVVKCLAFYHPADSVALRAEQDEMLKQVYQTCCRTGHELLLEIILPADMEQNENHYAEMIKHFYTIGLKPDWWKLPGVSAQAWQAISQVIEQNDPYCRGILILGLDAPEETFKQVFNASANAPLVKGFAVGRTIFGQPSAQWLAGELSDEQLIQAVSERYKRLIQLWKNRKN
ncbi:bifunctional 5-dehydro-2-deoxygluconokinase/5-dehydro-2-deoxyphosphogluconate aldolase [Avibacterium paragallinarum]|uniref:bifunctional 5-dehydro-2-deoxygluconokinase/5-dehydro-2- deoxyphosphogluconate aldolase n=1 Tax=Avibacterium paragallinarum TaxID=728 RepID=UPI00021AD466|nr:5-dehydro-2-deoxygluconokinase [Avibacterium paragallinarum]AZI14955.1 5-dehydro-2-deoxygluconokinase [Avibacterium paragallinarum]QIR12389.1 5-dehydro-2-deoxygluconokinase [Avibacterium paragallinarum]QJE10658.1 5-dehydro-2-deoxygluconokinase [Avibacterium paragallinarum]QJE12852.1 5-dehydro-2-deoxygluconokinase [Avibacterium paragallinarum]QJE15053.1 5-dehydro-2-deoxygluconokinase [Avibacterium paragallinarum]